MPNGSPTSSGAQHGWFNEISSFQSPRRGSAASGAFGLLPMVPAALSPAPPCLHHSSTSFTSFRRGRFWVRSFLPGHRPLQAETFSSPPASPQQQRQAGTAPSSAAGDMLQAWCSSPLMEDSSRSSAPVPLRWQGEAAAAGETVMLFSGYKRQFQEGRFSVAEYQYQPCQIMGSGLGQVCCVPSLASGDNVLSVHRVPFLSCLLREPDLTNPRVLVSAAVMQGAVSALVQTQSAPASLPSQRAAPSPAPAPLLPRTWSRETPGGTGATPGSSSSSTSAADPLAEAEVEAAETWEEEAAGAAAGVAVTRSWSTPVVVTPEEAAAAVAAANALRGAEASCPQLNRQGVGAAGRAVKKGAHGRAVKRIGRFTISTHEKV